MRTIFHTLSITALALAGCAAPQISVKEKWSQSIANYDLVPLYPMREDVFIGDVRIHRVEGQAGALDSRLLGAMPLDTSLAELEGRRPAYPVTGELPEFGGDSAFGGFKQTGGSLNPSGEAATRLRIATLPGFELLRITSADLAGGAASGIWNLVFGGSAESNKTLRLSLAGIETLEIADPEIASRFLGYVGERLRDDRFRFAVCAAAATLDDRALEDTAISLVTRVFYARAIDLADTDDFGAALEASVGQGAAPSLSPAATIGAEGNLQAPAVRQVDGGGDVALGVAIQRKARDRLTSRERFERPLAFGVDALMLDPRKLYPNLAATCEADADAVLTSPLRTDRW